jgi:branched-chain amino acid transport system substrate-binding protein
MPKAAGKYWDGKLYVHMELEPLDKDGVDTKNWQAVMAKYGNKKDPIDSFSQAGYLAAQVATNAMLGIKGNIDRKAFLDAAHAIKNVKTDMLCAPWYFAEGDRHQPNHNGRVALLAGGGFKVQTASCFQSKDADLADVLAYEAKTGVAK